MKAVCVKVCGVVEAEAGKALLEANGIRVEIVPYSEGALSAVAGGVGDLGLLVGEADARAALELLGEVESLEDPYALPLSLGQLKRLVKNEWKLGKSQPQLVEMLVQRGWEETAARQFVAKEVQLLSTVKPLSSTERAEQAQAHLRQMGRGLLQIGAGIVLTVGSRLLASQGGAGISLIFWGLVLWGVIDFWIGLSGWWKNRD